MRLWPFVIALGVFVACGSSGKGPGFGADDSGGAPTDGGAGADHTSLIGHDGSIGLGGDGGGGVHSCNPQSDDQQGCSCTSVGGTRACYTGPTGTRGIGLCKDGMQTCSGAVEAPYWGACTGSVLPAPEVCNGTVDANCNGKIACNDPTCTTTPLCDTGCTTGQTRACYTGPSGTENVGACKDGTQTCSNNTWGACNGQVLPQPTEDCCSPSDLNCNGLAGCYDLFACITASCCQSSCDAGGGLDPGCVCMSGSGDTATCPKGDHYVHKGGFPGTDECCPCTNKDCGAPNCCGESVCAGNAACKGLTCKTLPPSCKGQVSADCDDFSNPPEDCDEPCCECTMNCP